MATADVRNRSASVLASWLYFWLVGRVNHLGPVTPKHTAGLAVVHQIHNAAQERGVVLCGQRVRVRGEGPAPICGIENVAQTDTIPSV